MVTQESKQAARRRGTTTESVPTACADALSSYNHFLVIKLMQTSLKEAASVGFTANTSPNGPHKSCQVEQRLYGTHQPKTGGGVAELFQTSV